MKVSFFSRELTGWCQGGRAELAIMERMVGQTARVVLWRPQRERWGEGEGEGERGEEGEGERERGRETCFLCLWWLV